jgi:UDP-N-acetylmuramoylalanine--D-glutamate ligase
MLEGTVAAGREIAVIGLGRSGEAATKLLRHAGLPVYASDAGRSAELEATASELVQLGAAVDIGGHDLARIGAAALCIVSPGVPPDAAPLTAARGGGVPIRAEADLGLEALAGVPYVAITGTNGKSTTTALIGQLLLAGGRRALAVGNIGTPLSEIALLPVKPEWLAVELSSFQLHDLAEVRPAVGVLTNLSPDHLDRYARLEDYYADKKRMYLNAGPDSLWVSNADDPVSQDLLRDVPGRHLRFSVKQRAEAWFDRGTRTLRLGTDELLQRDELALRGDHNVANGLAAALAVHAAGIGIPALAEGLRTFRALPHRMEPVREVGGVLWINDSKATNIASTEVAVTALDRPFVLLLGGRHKGEPYTRLGPLLAGRCRAVVAYGEARPIVLRDLAGAGVSLVEAESFDEVMTTARALAQPGEVVLLSPACSSYDMFTNYGERGRRFREIVEAW